MAQLTVEKLFSELETKKIRPVYYLAGEEVYRKNTAVEIIKKIVNPDDFNYLSIAVDKSNISEVITTLNTPPAFSDKRLVIVKNAEKLKLPEKKSFIEYVENPLDTTCLIILSSERKQTDTLLKSCQQNGLKVVFYNLKDYQLLSWIKTQLSAKKISIASKALNFLADVSGGNMSLLAGEIEKISIYLNDSDKKEADYETVLDLLGFSKEENPFEVSGSLLDKNIKKVLSLIDKLLSSGQEPMFLLNIVNNTVTKALKVKRMLRKGMQREDIFKQAGLNAYYERDFIEKANAFFSEKKLSEFLEKSLETEYSFKSSAISDYKTTLQFLVTGLFAKKKS